MSQFVFPPLTANLDSEASNGGSLPSKQIIIGGYDGANVRAIKTDAAGELQVDISTSALPSGAATSALQTAGNNILTTIDADTSSLAGAVSGSELQVDVVASLPAGSNAIGDVDVLSSALPTGAATSALQTTANGILTTIDADTGTLAGAVSGTEMQVDVVASLPAGSNNIGDVDVLSVVPGVGATNLGKAIQSPQGTTDTGVPALVVRNDTLADLSGADGDYAPIQVNATGAVYTEVHSSALPTGAATSALQTAGNNILTTIDADTSSLAGCVSGTEVQVDVVSGSVTITNSMTPIDFLDAGVFDASTGTNIPSTGTGSATLVTLAADCKEIEVIDDIGEYMSLRVGGAVKAYLPLGGGRVKCHLSTGNAVTLFSETGTTINSGKIAMNFLA
jgi:predicted heme/steroid binding protein